jgi:uncharacterized protein (DUF1697 family)
MAVYVALLRGINVGGHHVIRMADLRDTFERAGGRDVETYIQSGNVVFAHAQRSAAKLTDDLERRIAKAAGFDVPLVVRTAAEFAAAIAANPFAGEPREHLHVLFLPQKPRPDALAALDAKAFLPERCAIAGRDVYLHLPGGMGRSKLAVAIGRVKTLAGATARNWRTTLQLATLAAAKTG